MLCSHIHMHTHAHTGIWADEEVCALLELHQWQKKSATPYILDRGRTSHMTVVKPVKNHQSALKQLASVNMTERN